MFIKKQSKKSVKKDSHRWDEKLRDDTSKNAKAIKNNKKF